MPSPLRILIAEDNPSGVDLLLSSLRFADFEPKWKCVDGEGDFSWALPKNFSASANGYTVWRTTRAREWDSRLCSASSTATAGARQSTPRSIVVRRFLLLSKRKATH